MRIAIVGAGWAGIRHLEAIQSLDGSFDTVAVCDSDRSQAHEVADRFDVQLATTDLNAILGDESIEVVDICTPHFSHATIAMGALDAGKHVLVEKPIATDTASASEMVQRADDRGLSLGVAEHVVYDDATRSIAAVLADRTVGAVVGATATWGFKAPGFMYPGRRSWLTDPQRGGTGTWMLQGIHRVAQLRFLLGEVTDVYAVESRGRSFERSDIEGTLTALLTMSGGFAVTLIQSSELSAPDSIKGLAIYGENGVITLAGQRIRVFDEGGDIVSDRVVAADPIAPYARELASFARHIRTASPYETTGRWETGSLAVVEAGYRSAKEGRSVAPEWPCPASPV